MKLTAEERDFYKHKILDLYLSGETSPTSIANRLQLKMNTVRYWISLYKERGLTAYLAQPDYRHNKGKVEPHILERLFLEMRENKARSYGFADDMWTLDRVSIVVSKKLNVTYDKKRLITFLRRYHVPYQSQSPHRASIEIKKTIPLMLRKSPRELEIENSDTWSLTCVQKILLKSLGHQYSKGHIQDLLRKNGYTIQRINRLRKTAA